MTMSRSTLAGSESNRRLRAHKKSRAGCGNCKLRKVKCDENKPTCMQCKAYRTLCNYNSKYSDLQPLGLGAGNCGFQILKMLPYSENSMVLAAVNTYPKISAMATAKLVQPHGGYDFSMNDLEFMHRFNTRTVKTLVQLGGSNGSEAWQSAYAELAYSHPFLMHIILALTMTHARHANTSSTTRHKNAAIIAFHMSRGAALLNNKLTHGAHASERDALWASAGLLGALAFSTLSATSPSTAWPLKPSSDHDLDWLTMTEGKKAIWKIADPMRPDSIFHPHVTNFLQYAHPTPSSSLATDLQNLPPELVRLCGVDVASLHLSNDASIANPHFAPLLFLASNITTPCTVSTMSRFLGFFGAMQPTFKGLLRVRDPAAMLLLATWYAKLCECPLWWSWRRASLEGSAICEFLRREYGSGCGGGRDEDRDIMAAVRWLEGVGSGFGAKVSVWDVYVHDVDVESSG